MHISGIKVKMIALKCKLTCNSFLTFTYSSLSCNVSKCFNNRRDSSRSANEIRSTQVTPYRMQYFLLLFGGNIKYGDVKLQTNVPDIEPKKQTILNLFLLYNIKKK